MYPEDEDEMRMHVESIAVVSRSNPVVTPVVELSVHTLKGFTAMGFAGFETRTAFTLVERNETKPTLCEYLKGLKDITDQKFYALIVQILEGLAALHKEGIIHRNFHKDCVFIEEKGPISVSNRNSEPVSEFSSIILQDINSTSNSILIFDRDQDITPECRISDFWFLRSPRGPGCVYSQGRADWGDKSTAPPEVRGGYKISYVSDIYAFGLCVLQWSRCADQHTDIDLDKNADSNHIAKKVNVKNIANDIMLGFGTAETKILPPPDPLKSLGSLVPARWGKNSWVQRMLRMILQENPRHRASAKDILIYLESVTFDDAL
jgi:serine/threonine protein kinase